MYVEINCKAESYRLSLYSGHPSQWSGNPLKQDSTLCNPTPQIKHKLIQIFKSIRNPLRTSVNSNRVGIDLFQSDSKVKNFFLFFIYKNEVVKKAWVTYFYSCSADIGKSNMKKKKECCAGNISTLRISAFINFTFKSLGSWKKYLPVTRCIAIAGT